MIYIYIGVSLYIDFYVFIRNLITMKYDPENYYNDHVKMWGAFVKGTIYITISIIVILIGMAAFLT